MKTNIKMDAELVRRWNAKVGNGDLVYVLGDLIWRTRTDDAPTLIKSLNGQIILIKGNHDRFLHNAKAVAALAAVKDYDDIAVKEIPNCIYNVGCMYWNYEPVTLDEILGGNHEEDTDPV